MSDLKPPGSFSGGPIEDFAEGWALIPFVGDRGHYWREITPGLKRQHIVIDDDVRVYRSLCGVTARATSRARAMNVGNWPRCIAIHARTARTARRLSTRQHAPPSAAPFHAAPAHRGFSLSPITRR